MCRSASVQDVHVSSSVLLTEGKHEPTPDLQVLNALQLTECEHEPQRD